MDYGISVPSLVILVSAVLVLSCRQTESHTNRITKADQRYTHATTVGMSKEVSNSKGAKLKVSDNE